MTNDDSKTTGTPIIFDGWRSITIAVFLSLIGFAVMVAVPVLSTALVMKEGFTDVQVGRIWGNDMLGLSMGSVLAAFLVARVNRRYLVVAAIIIIVGANALCMRFGNYETMLGLRIFAGIGSGIFTAVAVVTLGGTTNTVRAFNLLVLAFAFSQAFELRLIPHLDMNQVYWLFIGMPIVCGLFLKWLPAGPLSAEELGQQELGEDHIDNWQVPKFIPMICLVAICITYINFGGYYNYIDLAANESGITEEFMASTWTIVSLLGLVGCVIAFLCTRFGLYKPLFVGLITMSVVVALPSTGFTNTTVFISLFGVMVLWTFGDVFQSGMISHMDRSGSMVALVPAVQGLGQSIGPWIASVILDYELGYGVLFVVSSCMPLIAMLLYVGIFLYTRKKNVASSEAS